MLCSCCTENINDLDNMFGEKDARRYARRYLKKGLEKRAQKLIAHVLAYKGEPLTVLDIGGGAGSIHQELLRRGIAASAVGVDASSAYIQAAELNARKLELAEKTKYHHADFALNADDFEAADVVVLDRVICCYPHLEELLTAAAERAQKFLALSFPREDWWIKVIWQIEVFFLALNRNKFHAYIHPHDKINAVAAQAGLRRVHSDRQGIWQIAVFERSA